MTCLADLERYEAIAAYIVIRHGDDYVPTFERLEREVAEERTRIDNRARAQRVVAASMKKGVTYVSAG